MMNWKFEFVVIGVAFSIIAAIGGYYTGIVLADPPLDVSAQQNLLMQAVRLETIKQTGVEPFSIRFLGDTKEGRPLVADVTGAVLDDQPQVRHFIVELHDDSEQASVLRRSGGDAPPGSIDGVVLGEVIPKSGKVNLYNVRF
jgi:hypothetical protein